MYYLFDRDTGGIYKISFQEYPFLVRYDSSDRDSLGEFIYEKNDAMSRVEDLRNILIKNTLSIPSDDVDDMLKLLDRLSIVPETDKNLTFLLR